ncbi:hypothetical protein DFH94DRAFT_720440 [Russula ochroleuca]|uniref:Uncharacterized protein n=1 Tax=Russula ochroleuca TaxID=152965 RepID=A0A9P5N455_9AGAM|nr:hypothetical protein DFH94DRAFT_720440 [Russula ochroleuca]
MQLPRRVSAVSTSTTSSSPVGATPQDAPPTHIPSSGACALLFLFPQFGWNLRARDVQWAHAARVGRIARHATSRKTFGSASSAARSAAGACAGWKLERPCARAFEERRNQVCGTITPEGNADTYCYACNVSQIDPELVLRLTNFGVNVQTLKKTEKTMTELKIEHKLNLDLSESSRMRQEMSSGLFLVPTRQACKTSATAVTGLVIQVLLSSRPSNSPALLLAVQHWTGILSLS